jgi:uncharacterized cysteine cluster protein YcgN (CxxCxxCC family)
VRELRWLPEECAYVEHVRHKDTLVAVREIARTKKRSRNSKGRR